MAPENSRFAEYYMPKDGVHHCSKVMGFLSASKGASQIEYIDS